MGHIFCGRQREGAWMCDELLLNEFYKDIDAVNEKALPELLSTKVFNKIIAGKVERYLRVLKGCAVTIDSWNLVNAIDAAEELCQLFKIGKYVSFDGEITLLYTQFFSFLGEKKNLGESDVDEFTEKFTIIKNKFSRG